MPPGFFFSSFSCKYNLCGDRQKIIIYGDCPAPCAVVASADWDLKQGAAYVCNTEGEGGNHNVRVPKTTAPCYDRPVKLAECFQSNHTENIKKETLICLPVKMKESKKKQQNLPNWQGFEAKLSKHARACIKTDTHRHTHRHTGGHTELSVSKATGIDFWEPFLWKQQIPNGGRWLIGNGEYRRVGWGGQETRDRREDNEGRQEFYFVKVWSAKLKRRCGKEMGPVDVWVVL